MGGWTSVAGRTTLNHMRKAGLITGIALALSGAAACAQTPINMPIADTLALTRQPFLARDAFMRALLSALPGLSVEPDTTDPAIMDPFLWALSGSFGLNGTRAVPGAIFACARYGLATRDYFAEHRLYEPEVFALMGQVLPLHDDPEVWPDGAVARLHCSFVWDDERVVYILGEAFARAALEAVFTDVRSVDVAASAQGTGSFRLEASHGPQDSVRHVEGAGVVLTQGHQSVTFRSFLMGGGM